MSLLKKLPEISFEKTGWPWTEEYSSDNYDLKKKYPRISIVTPSFNQGDFIEETIRSVLLQNYPNLEYIIIDGGSTDCTINVIKKYEPWITYFVSEKDRGQSHAINKGLIRSTGKVFNWINSDDFYESGALKYVGEKFLGKEVQCVNAGINHIKNGIKYKFSRFNTEKDVELLYCNPVMNQPSIFYSSEALKKIGLLTEELHFAMDYEWWIKYLYLFGHKVTDFSETPLSNFRIHQDSKTGSEHQRFKADIAKILYSISKQRNSLPVLQGLLEKMIHINTNYRFNLSVENIEESVIEKQIVFFLLKWNNKTWDKKQFGIMKKLIPYLSTKPYIYHEMEKKWLANAKNNLQFKSFELLKLINKIKHLWANWR